MWKNVRLLLVVLSVGFNAAFVGVWASRTVGARFVCPGPDASQAGKGGIWCPLHRKLGTTDAQWRQIEPLLADFRKSAQTTCQDVGRKRTEMMDLIASPQPAPDAIRAKQEEIIAGQRRMQELVIAQLLSEKKILTQAQQKELFEMIRNEAACSGQGQMLGLGRNQ